MSYCSSYEIKAIPEIFEGVRQYPIRVKCATLAWRALEEALKENTDKQEKVTTEE